MSDAVRPDFMRRQYEFAAHIRDPVRNRAPDDIEERRMAIYRDLFYNNIEGFLSNSFPVLRELIEDQHWHALVRDFFARHRCHTPLFLEISREFLVYLEDERTDRSDDLPFLRELAHYEWVELALSVAEADELEREFQEAAVAGRGADLLDGTLKISPLAWPLAYRYPVHRISPEFIPEQPGEQLTYLLVYRDRDDAVNFVELNPVSARLLELLQDDTALTARTALRQIAAELQHPSPDVVIDGGEKMLEEWRQRGILLISPD